LIFSFDLFECISEPLVITHGPASQIKITQQPNAVQFTGNPIVPFPEVMLYDSFGNLATSSSTLVRTCASGAVDCDTAGPVRVQSVDVLPILATAMFERMYLFWERKDSTPGPFISIRFYLSKTPSVSAVSVPFQVCLNELKLVITSQPSFVKVEETMRTAPVVEIQDAGGYTFSQVSGGFSYLHLNVSMAQASSPSARLSRNGQACPCLVRIIKGIAVITGLAIDKPGTFHALRFSLPIMGIADVLSSQFSVSGLASYAYVHLQPPLTIVYGNYFQVILMIRDANNVPVLTDSVSAAVYISNPSTCLEARPPLMSGRLTAAAPRGEANFTDLTIDRAYSCAMRICFWLDSGATSIPHLLSASVCTNDFSAKNGPPHRLLLMAPISNCMSSDPLMPRPKVSVLDKANNIVLDFNGTIKAVLYDRNISAISLYSVFAVVIAGIAHFDIIVQKPGSAYQLEFQAWQQGNASDLRFSSNSFDVFPGSIANLVLVKQPGNGVANMKLSKSAVVAAVDKGGYVSTSFAGLVVAVKASGQVGANSALGGIIKAIAKDGLAIFDGLVVNESDTRFVVRFMTNSSCAMEVLSMPFAITGNTTSFVQLTLADGGQGGATFGLQPRFQAMDQRLEATLLTVGYVCARLAVTPAPWVTAANSLSGTRSASFKDGVAVFTDLTINKKGTYGLVYDLVITSNTDPIDACVRGPFISSINQSGFTVGTGPVARMQLDDAFSDIKVTGGSLFLISPVIVLYDAGNNLLSDDSVTDIRVTIDYLGYKRHPPSLKSSGKLYLHTHFEASQWQFFDSFKHKIRIREMVNTVHMSQPGLFFQSRVARSPLLGLEWTEQQRTCVSISKLAIH
jgi:hypothetical protein